MKNDAQGDELSQIRAVLSQRFDLQRTKSSPVELLQCLVDDAHMRKSLDQDPAFQRRQALPFIAVEIDARNKAEIRAEQAQGQVEEARPMVVRAVKTEQTYKNNFDPEKRKKKLSSEELQAYLDEHPIEGTKREVWIAEAMDCFNARRLEKANALYGSVEVERRGKNKFMVKERTIGDGLVKLGQFWPRKKLVQLRS